MADLRLFDKNNQRKEVSVFASAPLDTSATLNDILFTLPEASLVTRAYAVVTSPSGVASSDVDIKVGSTTVGGSIPVTADGVQVGTQTMTYFPTGGRVTVVAGGTAPDNAGVLIIIVEYIETRRSEGTYTD